MSGPNSTTQQRQRTRIRALTEAIFSVFAVAYPCLLGFLVILFHEVGERHWATGVGLYLPRWLFGLPLPALVLALVLMRRWRLLWLQLAALLLLLFPLMGLVLPLRSAASLATSIRVVSCNVNSGASGYPAVVERIVSLSPDLVLLQEVADTSKVVPLLQAHFARVFASSEFVVASLSSVRDIVEPPPVLVRGSPRSPRFLRFVVDAPHGPMAVYNVHPVSPRSSFYALRGQGFRKEILSGRLFAGANVGEMEDRSAHREAQISAVAKQAAGEQLPVLIAGDLNLAGLSPVLRLLSAYRDGFSEAGAGFGYTYPTDKRLPPFLRLDRILTSPSLRFARFEVLATVLSDHHCVVAELGLAAE